ncbi:PepSY domain-containing protein [Pelagovum pacificum]|uniref:PepSY domain-containing protein n=1 Tax=Pelagovum pacificum TaxID=2588711 RepID=A0A5C5GGZ7_9RHOB|nr:PepSY domain-containing protein [Pelagovum pacificum]QQA43626.1 PepSY domain-containing protein [Pelagovum pacificum]TNY33239.1 PepSY domain-containing protein [Pelagovum pacificum]
MKQLLSTALILLPLSAAAMPAVGDLVGTEPEQATAALEAAGCLAPDYEAEDGKIEAKCQDAEGHMWEVYIDPTSGTVSEIKSDD